MLMRSLCTGLLALLAWLPVGHAQSRALRGNPHEPALASTSALDVAADSPSRVGNAGSFGPRTLPPRGPGRAATGDGASFAEAVLQPAVGASRGVAVQALGRHVAHVRAKRLTIPYDATAPPRHQS